MTDEERAWATRNTWDSSCWTAGERGAIAKCIADELAAVRAESEAEIQALKAQVVALRVALDYIQDQAEQARGHAGQAQFIAATLEHGTDGDCWKEAHAIGARTFCIINKARRMLSEDRSAQAAREHDERLVRLVVDRAARMASRGMSHTMIFERCDCAECAILRLTLSDIQEKP